MTAGTPQLQSDWLLAVGACVRATGEPVPCCCQVQVGFLAAQKKHNFIVVIFCHQGAAVKSQLKGWTLPMKSSISSTHWLLPGLHAKR